MIYVYYEPATKQIMAIFDTPNLSNQVSWEAKGYTRALVRDGLRVNRDQKVKTEAGGTILTVEASVNPEQPVPNPRSLARQAARQSAAAKLKALGLTDEELTVMGMG